ncbi:hypothetical protein [Vibrio parahaemolyticus]|uniref:hypothetical protein n=1 Tax=Vibrio parahaemolyticus TaxID=670 RepID=UPI001123FF57|nr:hypothetical protein [Vibrio parahaemolyticus]MCZ5859989.1 hypothetical protein [Vibrio parahaemolyticus]MCZ6278752.1 hypothetical protein [Vibrio parahaemolyticus]MDF4619781.1 hypothetical protein [Vibrio parahaemolyticus]MDF5494765.1 hypothetical protein [Vibrio parahaemolyticus]QGT89695.1 hypothetical protein GNY17_01795 [Vibrio parahaemolyticus]
MKAKARYYQSTYGIGLVASPCRATVDLLSLLTQQSDTVETWRHDSRAHVFQMDKQFVKERFALAMS